MASGGLLGSGLGHGAPQYIPVRESDYIFAVIVEELGMIFAFLILIIYFLMFYRNIRSALKATSNFYIPSGSRVFRDDRHAGHCHHRWCAEYDSSDRYYTALDQLRRNFHADGILQPWHHSENFRGGDVMNELVTKKSTQ